MIMENIHEMPTLPSPIMPLSLPQDEAEATFFAAEGEPDDEGEGDEVDLVDDREGLPLAMRRDLSAWVSAVVLFATVLCFVALAR
jgi:hypothetical protein